MKYKGEECCKCGNVFAENDDIVVCPQCGSPHHRECYKSDNKCANDSRHGEGFKWTPAKRTPQKEDHLKIKKVCPSCGGCNDFAASVCCHCNAPLQNFQDGNTKNYHDLELDTICQFFSIDNKKKIKGISMKDIMYFVRDNNIYYLPIFSRMNQTGKNMSFNLLCLIYPPLYFANRRMWFWAVLSVLISVILFMPFAVSSLAGIGNEGIAFSFFNDSVTETLLANSSLILAAAEICNVVDMIIHILFCLFGNRLYFGYVVKNVRRLGSEEYGSIRGAKLKAYGGLRPMNSILIILINISLTLLGTLCCVSLLEKIL